MLKKVIKYYYKDITCYMIPLHAPVKEKIG